MLSKNKLWLNQFYRPKEDFSLIERKKFPSFFSLALFSSFRKIFFNFYQQKNIFSFSLLSNNFFFSHVFSAAPINAILWMIGKDLRQTHAPH